MMLIQELFKEKMWTEEWCSLHFSSSTKLSDGKPMKGGDGRLTEKAIEKLKKKKTMEKLCVTM